MDRGQLESFVTVAHTLHFGKAAEQLHLTQPAISAHIRQLEAELGTRLFDRWGRRTELTASGKLLLEHAERILNQFIEAEQALRDAQGVASGLVRIGSTSSLIFALFAPVLRACHERYPQVQVEVHSLSSAQVIAAVLAGDLDLGITYLHEPEPDLTSDILMEDTFMLIAPPDHPLARRSEISLTDLRDEPLLYFTHGTAGRSLLDARFAEAGITPKIYLELDLSSALLRLVAGGLGVALVSHLAVADDPVYNQVRIVPVRELRKPAPVVVLAHRDRYQSLAVRAVHDLLRNHAGT